jgi:hypothetical protein
MLLKRRTCRLYGTSQSKKTADAKPVKLWKVVEERRTVRQHSHRPKYLVKVDLFPSLVACKHFSWQACQFPHTWLQTFPRLMLNLSYKKKRALAIRQCKAHMPWHAHGRVSHSLSRYATMQSSLGIAQPEGHKPVLCLQASKDASKAAHPETLCKQCTRCFLDLESSVLVHKVLQQGGGVCGSRKGANKGCQQTLSHHLN